MKEKGRRRWGPALAGALVVAVAACGSTKQAATEQTITTRPAPPPRETSAPTTVTPRRAPARQPSTTSTTRTTSAPTTVTPRRAPARQPSTTSTTRTTATPTVTVMGGGNPATWPAARAKPPSLAGAYSPNLRTAFIALIRYSDWVGSHPNPDLVKNYTLGSSNIYIYQVRALRVMVTRGWHLPPWPSQVNFLTVVHAPIAQVTTNGKRLLRDGHQAYTRGVLDVVMDEQRAPYLDSTDRIVGYSGGGGVTALTINLRQGSDGRFRIDEWRILHPASGITAWEKKVEHRP